MTFTDKNKLKHKHFQTYLMSLIGPKMKPSKVQKRHYDVINLEISKTEKKTLLSNICQIICGKYK